MTNLDKIFKISDYEDILQKTKMDILQLYSYDEEEKGDKNIAYCHLIRAFHEVNLAIESLRLVKIYLQEKKE
jgi:hypothetical protein